MAETSKTGVSRIESIKNGSSGAKMKPIQVMMMIAQLIHQTRLLNTMRAINNKECSARP